MEVAVWFIAGMLAGFLSLRAMGWLCLVGVCLLPFDSRAVVNITIQNDTVGSTHFSVLRWTKWTGAVCGSSQNWSCLGHGTLAPGASTTVASYDTDCAGCSVTYELYKGGNFCDNSGATLVQTKNSPTGCESSGWTMYISGNAPAPQYIFNGACITNNSAGILGFYGHLSTSVGGSQDYYSGPLAPGGYWCLPALTNSSPFTLEWQRVFYNSDGGTNAIDQFPPIAAGTNSPPGVQGGSVAGGPGSAVNPVQGGASGQGSNTNLTGGQFQTGVSNLVNVVYDGNQLLASGLRTLARGLGPLTNLPPNMATNIDYSGYFQTLTNEGRATTNQLSNLGSLLSGTNFNGTNVSDMWSQLLSAATSDALSQSNAFWTNSSQSIASWGQASNISDLAAGDFDLWIIPGLYTNTARTGLLNFNFTANPLWNDLAPWIRLVFTFAISIFAIYYIDERVGEEMLRLNLVPGASPLKAGYVGVFSGFLSIGVTAVALAAIPALIAAGIATVYSFSGGVAFSPLSSIGASSAGGHAGYVRLGIYVLEQVFPLSFAVTITVYLFTFNLWVRSAVLFAQRLIRLVSN